MKKGLTKNINTIVIKVGTSIITSGQNRLDRRQIRNISFQISGLMKNNKRIVLVSSGAIGAAMGLLGSKSRPSSLPKLQAHAAVGQPHLINIYNHFFRQKGILTAQILLTWEDLRNRKRYLNAKNTIFALLERKILPIVNENDTVSVDEIKFGDNDKLSSLVANLVEADLLILLSDVDGLFKLDAEKKCRELIDVVEEISPDIQAHACDTQKESSLGGMITKLEAAKIAVSSGIPLIIANGKKKDILLKILAGEGVGTLFLPKVDKLKAKKKWLAFTSKPKGSIIVDDGARSALIEGNKSLLSSGVLGTEGNFHIGDAILICDQKKKGFARGLTNYSSLDMEKIKGLKTADIEKVLGKKFYDEVVHRDNLVIL